MRSILYFSMIALLLSFQTHAKAARNSIQCTEVGPESSYTHVDPDIADRNAEAHCQARAGSGQACYSKGCVQIPNGNYTCTYSIYTCR